MTINHLGSHTSNTLEQNGMIKRFFRKLEVRLAAELSELQARSVRAERVDPLVQGGAPAPDAGLSEAHGNFGRTKSPEWLDSWEALSRL